MLCVFCFIWGYVSPPVRGVRGGGDMRVCPDIASVGIAGVGILHIGGHGRGRGETPSKVIFTGAIVPSRLKVIRSMQV